MYIHGIRYKNPGNTKEGYFAIGSEKIMSAFKCRFYLV